MSAQLLPETTIAHALKREIDLLARTFTSVEDAEAAALKGEIVASLQRTDHWAGFCHTARSAVSERGYVVVRGLEADQGRSLLIISAALDTPFDFFGKGNIVKRFRMSPWTNELSHTIREGEFHTDGNVSPRPPASTAIQCEIEDPGVPEYGEQRVAHLPTLLERLASGDREDAHALAFLTESTASMAHERSPLIWKGVLVQNGTIRYHPHSLRVANKRADAPIKAIETIIARIHLAARDSSVPFHTQPGDTVLVSNRTALHYRGACSVRFTHFPTEFDARSVLVLHLRDSAE